MMPNTQNASPRTLFFLNLTVPELQDHFRQRIINEENYPEIIKEMVQEYKAIKKEIEVLKQQNYPKILVAYNESKYGEQMSQKVIEMNTLFAEQQKQTFQKQQEQLKESQQLLSEKQKKIDELTMKIVQRDQLPQTLLPIVQAQQNGYLRNFEEEWSNIYDQTQSVQQQILTLMNNNTQNNSNIFLQFQRNISNDRIFELQRLIEQKQQILMLAQRLRDRIINKSNQGGESQIHLQQVSSFLVNYISIMQKSLELWQYVIEENQSIKNSNEKLQEQNRQLTIEINRINQQHADDVKKLVSDFEKTKENLQNQTTMEFIRNSLTSNQIQTLSCIIQILQLEKSLEIHQQFYQTIKKNLDKVALKFLEISMNNIHGSFLSIKSQQQFSPENRMQAISQIKEFKRQISQENGISMQVCINNGIQLLTAFEPFFTYDNLDRKFICFTRSYNNSYNALKSLQNYLESIAQGVQKFEEQHAILKNLEPVRQ